jgi:predicted signal transduction protein with EAL and GGDEF domain
VDADPEVADGGVVEQVVCTLSDVSERKRAEDRLSHIARYGQLTGLVNRELFGDRLDRVLAVPPAPAGRRRSCSSTSTVSRT